MERINNIEREEGEARDELKKSGEKQVCNNQSFIFILNSPLHVQFMTRWHLAPGLLKSHAAHVASSTMADGYKKNTATSYKTNNAGLTMSLKIECILPMF